MDYRIRYHEFGQQGEAEMLIDANSPNEAMVKFRCTRRLFPSKQHYRDEITSVSLAEKVIDGSLSH